VPLAACKRAPGRADLDHARSGMSCAADRRTWFWRALRRRTCRPGFPWGSKDPRSASGQTRGSAIAADPALVGTVVPRRRSKYAHLSPDPVNRVSGSACTPAGAGIQRRATEMSGILILRGLHFGWIVFDFEQLTACNVPRTVAAMSSRRLRRSCRPSRENSGT